MTRFEQIGVYGLSASSTLVAKIIFYGSSFIALWLATQLLVKPDYGSYAFAVAIMWVASLPVALGLDQTVLVRVARGMTDAGEQGLVSSALLTALAIGTGLAVAIAIFAGPLAQLAGAPKLERWLIALAPTIPLIAIGSLCQNWYISRGDVWRGQIYPAIGHAMRVPVLGVAFVSGGAERWIIAAEILVAAVPILLFLLDRKRPRLQPPKRAEGTDMIFGARLLVVRIASEGIRRIDIFMLGGLATAVAVADYSIAARLVVALDLGRELLQPAFTARVGRLLAQSDRADAKHEYESIRAVSFLLCLMIASVLVFVARPALAFFGDFASAFWPLMILIAGGLVNAAFGPNGQFLMIAGHATRLLTIRLVMLVILFLGNLILIPIYGAMGAAIANGIAVTLVNLFCWHGILKLERINSMDMRTTTALMVALAAVAATATGVLSSGVGAIAMASVTAAYASREPRSWKLTSMTLKRLYRGV